MVPKDVLGKNRNSCRTLRYTEEVYGVKAPFTVSQAY